MAKLKGKIALITDGSSGIGLATAKQFVNEGAHVFVTGASDSELAAAVEKVGANVTSVRADVSNIDDLDRMYAEIKKKKSVLNVVFASASIETYVPVGELTAEGHRFNSQINLRGLLFTVQKALPLLSDGASLILNTSFVAREGGPAKNADNATRAVRSFGHSWARDLKNRCIRVNALNSGPIDASRTKALVPAVKATQQRWLGMDDRECAIVEAVTFLASNDSQHITETELFADDGLLSNNIPLGRLGTVDEIATAVVFLASDNSSHITGMELFVGAGLARL